MTGKQASLTRRSLKTPGAAAVAGILFALLYGTSLILVCISLPTDMAAEPAWLENNIRTVAFALNLVPYAGIVFLWFIGVIRDRVVELEDRFFATIFLGSGLLLLALTFTGAALAGGLPREREILVICRSGQRAYYAARILLQNGFVARILSGGMLSRTILY